MLQFTVRIVLHNATSEDYAKLEIAMSSVGFIDTIVSDNGQTYVLPDAEYQGVAADIDTAFQLATTAVSTVGRNYAIFISETVRWTYIGLQQVK